MTDPVAFARRSPLRRRLEAAGAAWGDIGDAAIAESVGEAPPFRGLGIVDLSPLPRLGFKGRGTIPAMQARGITVEATPNRAFRQPDGGLCLVLAPGEVILLSNLAGDAERLAQLETNWRIEDEERTYPLPRRDSHAWLAVAGAGRAGDVRQAVRHRSAAAPSSPIWPSRKRRLPRCLPSSFAPILGLSPFSTCLWTVPPPYTSAIVSSMPPTSSAGASSA